MKYPAAYERVFATWCFLQGIEQLVRLVAAPTAVLGLTLVLKSCVYFAFRQLRPLQQVFLVLFC